MTADKGRARPPARRGAAPSRRRGARKVTATEETTVTVSQRREVTVEDGDDEWPTLVFAAGWQPGAEGQLTGGQLREQRTGQAAEALAFLEIRASGELGPFLAARPDARGAWPDGVPASYRDTIQCAANILRAGPGSSPAERRHGRLA